MVDIQKKIYNGLTGRFPDFSPHIYGHPVVLNEPQQPPTTPAEYRVLGLSANCQTLVGDATTTLLDLEEEETSGGLLRRRSTTTVATVPTDLSPRPT